MKKITAEEIRDTVADLCVKANCVLRSDVLRKLKEALRKEKNPRAKSALKAIVENARIAKKERLAICQDTGLPIVFAELGRDLRIIGDLKQAIMKGVEAGYSKGNFRESIVRDPLKRGRSVYRGAVIHLDAAKGSKLKITLLSKGFGCENKSRLKMFNPTAGLAEIKQFIVDTVREAGADACPPYVVGVGIGGAADYAGLLAKKALLRRGRLPQKGAVPGLEKELLSEINKLEIGPMGLGGKATCLKVNILAFPTHIAGLPVAVNISCHALRSAGATL